MRIRHFSIAFICLILADLVLACVFLMSLQKASEPTIKYLISIREDEKNITGSLCRFKSDDWRFLSQMIIKREIIPENLIGILNHRKNNPENGDTPDLILVPNPSGDVWIILNSKTEEWSVVSNNFRIPKKEYVTVFISEPQ